MKMVVIYMYIARGQGQTSAWGQTFFIKGVFSQAIFLWQRSIVTETFAKYLRSHTETKSLKENLSKNLC